ncbi:S8 family serine peptidase [candidate division KSB1 bacterium]|nr:S8 family serine peptidase [candidate division KSB1 bacterium]
MSKDRWKYYIQTFRANFLIWMLILFPISVLAERPAEVRADDCTEWAVGELIVQFTPEIMLDSTGFSGNNEIDSLLQELDVVKICPLFNAGSSDEILHGTYLFSFAYKIISDRLINSFSRLENVIFAEPNYLFNFAINAPQRIPTKLKINSVSELPARNVATQSEKPTGLSESGQVKKKNIVHKNKKVRKAFPDRFADDDVVIAVVDGGKLPRSEFEIRHLMDCQWHEDENATCRSLRMTVLTNFADNVETMPDSNNHIQKVGRTILHDCLPKEYIPYKLLLIDAAGKGSSCIRASDASSSIVKAVLMNVDIINLSWNSKHNSRLLQQALAFAYEKNVLIVAAAGNQNEQTKQYPAAYQHVLSVTAVDETGVKSQNANYGKWIDIAAFETSIDKDYDNQETGTSLAAAHVSAVAARAVLDAGNVQVDSLIQIISQSVLPVNDKNPRYSGKLGIGIIDQQHIQSHYSEIVYTTNIPDEDTSIDKNNALSGTEAENTQLDVSSTEIGDLNHLNENDSTEVATGINSAVPPSDDSELMQPDTTLQVVEKNNEASPETAFTNSDSMTTTGNESTGIDSTTSITTNSSPDTTLMNQSVESMNDTTVANGYVEADASESSGIVDSDSFSFVSSDSTNQSVALDTTMLSSQESSEFASTDTSSIDTSANTSIISDSLFFVDNSIVHDTTKVDSGSITELFQPESIVNTVSALPVPVFFPTDTQILQWQDSLLFRVMVDSFAYSTQWFINRQDINSQADSVWLSQAADGKNIFDTVRVKLNFIDIDATISHEWLVQRNLKNLFEAKFFPISDTTISIHDSLLLHAAIPPAYRDSVAFKWIVNDSLCTVIDSLFQYHASVTGLDSIRLEIHDANDAGLAEHIWYIRAVVSDSSLRTIPEFTFVPDSIISIASGDSIQLQIVPALTWDEQLYCHWKTAYDSSSGQNVLSYMFVATSADSAMDTVSVKVLSENMNHLASHNWQIITYPEKLVTSDSSVFNWHADTLINVGDTMQCVIPWQVMQRNSLAWIWYHNGILTENLKSTSFTYIAEPNTDSLKNQIKAIGKNAANDTLAICVWQIRLQSSTEEHRYTFSPCSDTTIIRGDTLYLAVRGDSSLVQYHWYLNQTLVDTANDDKFNYTTFDERNQADSIAVIILSEQGDTLDSFYWQINVIQQELKNDKQIIFSPPQDTTLTPGETLHLYAQWLMPADSLKIQWLVNDSLTSITDSVFFYTADQAQIHDIVTMNIQGNDSLLTHSWTLHIRQQDSTVVAQHQPQLIYPFNGDAVCDGDIFKWRRDTATVLNKIYPEYVVEIALDSLFQTNVVVDSCGQDTTLVLKDFTKLAGLLQAGKRFFWRVRNCELMMDEFQLAAREFVYYPEFSELASPVTKQKTDGTINIQWRIENGFFTAGFNVYRSQNQNGGYQKLNSSIIVGQEQYTFNDASAILGQTFYYQLEQVSRTGNTKKHSPIALEATTPMHYELFQNFPNPFNGMTQFKYQIPHKTHVMIHIYNVLGRKIRTLIDEDQDAGFYTLSWDGQDERGEPVVSSIYFYQLHTRSFKATRKMTIVR